MDDQHLARRAHTFKAGEVARRKLGPVSSQGTILKKKEWNLFKHHHSIFSQIEYMAVQFDISKCLHKSTKITSEFSLLSTVTNLLARPKFHWRAASWYNVHKALWWIMTSSLLVTGYQPLALLIILIVLLRNVQKNIFPPQLWTATKKIQLRKWFISYNKILRTLCQKAKWHTQAEYRSMIGGVCMPARLRVHLH